MRLNLQHASGPSGPGGAALALRVIRLETRHGAQKQRRVPSAPKQLHRRIEAGRRFGPETPGAQHQTLEPLSVRLARLVVLHPHVQVVPMLGQIVGMGHALKIPDVDRVVDRFDELSGQLVFQRILRWHHGVLHGLGTALSRRRERHLRSTAWTTHPAGPRTAPRLVRQRLLPGGRQTLIRQPEQGARRQQFDQLPPTRRALRETCL